jgi:hypothetical protein
MAITTNKPSPPPSWFEVARSHPSRATDLGGLAVAIIAALAFVAAKLGLIAGTVAGDIAGWIAAAGLVFIGLVRLVRAPFWIIKDRDEEIARLNGKLDKYERGPSFLLGADGPNRVVSGRWPDGRQCAHVTMPLRITNEGTPGAALGWTVTFEVPGQDPIECSAFTVPDEGLLFQGVTEGELRRGEMIGERTSTRIETGTTLYGYFVADIPYEQMADIGRATRFVVRCTDARGRETTLVKPMQVLPKRGHEVSAPPTLGAFQFYPPPDTPPTPLAPSPSKPDSEALPSTGAGP